MSSKIIGDMISEGHKFITCFDLVLNNKKVIYLNSSNNILVHDEISYLPNSGVVLSSAEFNDSAHNEIKLKGIFEKGGIEQNLNLDAAMIKIFFYFPQKSLFLSWLILECEKIEHDGMSFVLILKNQTMKLHQSVLQTFSTTCRANFGDKKCKIDINRYSEYYDVISIESNIVKTSGSLKPDGFYNGGKLVFQNGFSYDIKTHVKNMLVLTKNCDANAPLRATLIPSCDKKFVTCCNRYDNAVNFRGEPNIPFG